MNMYTTLKALLLVCAAINVYGAPLVDPCTKFKCPNGESCFLTDAECIVDPCPPPTPGCRAESKTTPLPPPTLRAPSAEGGLYINPCQGMICRSGYVCKIIPSTNTDCTNDDDCAPGRSCVLAGYVKEGRCPASPEDIAIGDDCVEECVGDDSCPGNQKCCGTCPARCRAPLFDTITTDGRIVQTTTPGFPFITCETTMCSPGFVCYDEPTDCGKPACRTMPTCKVAPVKLGSCPDRDEESPCATPHTCGIDDHCDGEQKCCGVCGKRCVDPVFATARPTTAMPTTARPTTAMPTTTTSTTSTTTQSIPPPENICSADTCEDGYECRYDPPQCAAPGCTQTLYCAALVMDCKSKSETGRCKASIPRWYYNAASKTCEQFTYGGCGGNANNYLTEDLCLITCTQACPPWTVWTLWSKWVEVPGSTPCVERRTRTRSRGAPCEQIEIQMEDRPCRPLVMDCKSKSETGRCKASIPRWYYNAASKTCEQFTYGGCGGNANNYLTEDLCLITCTQACPPWTVWTLWSKWVEVPGSTPCVERRTRTRSRGAPCEQIEIQMEDRPCRQCPPRTPWSDWVAVESFVPCMEIRTRTNEGCSPVDFQNRVCVDPTTTPATPSTAQTTVTKSLCPDGETHLSGIFCGRGLNRQNCPSGYECNIHPTDRYAVCCPERITTTRTPPPTTMTTPPTARTNPTTTKTTRRTGPPPIVNSNCEYEVIPFGAAAYKAGWYQVKNSPWVKQPCPGGLIFMESLCRCDWP